MQGALVIYGNELVKQSLRPSHYCKDIAHLYDNFGRSLVPTHLRRLMITHEAMFLGGNRSHSEIERFLADPVGWSAINGGRVDVTAS